MTTTERVIEARRRDPNRPATTMAEEFGVSRERVRQILQRAGLPTSVDAPRRAPVPKGKWRACHNECGKLVYRAPSQLVYRRTFCSRRCNNLYRMARGELRPFGRPLGPATRRCGRCGHEWLGHKSVHFEIGYEMCSACWYHGPHKVLDTPEEPV